MLFALLALAGCGSGKGNPFASFESRCAQLPRARFDVVQVPVSYREDGSQSIAALTRRSGTPPATHRTVGLTTATIGYQAQIELRAVSDSRGGRACGTPNVHVELSLQPMTIYIAHELADNRCERESTLEHELKHVAVHREALEEASAELREALPAAIGVELRTAWSQAELERILNLKVRNYLSEFIEGRHRLLRERQAEVDSPDEYQRLTTLCR